MDAGLHGEAVENLVSQFSSSLDFYRELVQNSIDAGSSSVEVWMEYVPGGGVDGTIAIHVDDFGEGMNEAIIDDQLTTLFSSSKENDLTKIGKFGIGFVSVFALEPRGVLVHTGRDGESWEVFFDHDRSFVKSRLDAPVEGTQLTIFVEGGRGRYRELVRGTRETLAKWCSHSSTEITFEDRSPTRQHAHGIETINRAFSLPADVSVRVDHPGTEIVVGFSHTPIYGFYNKGLALAVTSAGHELLEARTERYRHVGFKIKSRYLEHTLSRETVMRDANFDKAMAWLDDAVNGPLRDALLGELEGLCAQAEWSMADRTRYELAMAYLAAEPREALFDLGPRAILRTVDGKGARLVDAKRAFERDGRSFVAGAPSALTASLADHGVPVFLSGSTRLHSSTREPVASVVTGYVWQQWRREPVGIARRLMGADLRELVEARVVHPESVFVHVRPAPATPSQTTMLLRDAAAVLDATDQGYHQLAAGAFHGDPDVLFAIGPKVTSLMQRIVGDGYERGWFERPSVLVNIAHPHVRELVELSAVDRSMAAYCLAKAVLLEENRNLKHDEALVLAAKAVVR